MGVFFSLLLLAAVIWFVVQFQHKPRRAAPPQNPTLPLTSGKASAERDQLPASFPVQTKPSFFSHTECQLYEDLQEALHGSSYTVFPNVRLNDLMLIKASGSERQAVLGRLRDKHVDFLIVARANYRPLLGIELDGASHHSEKQQYRDTVKDILFASARLPLIRLDARQRHHTDDLRELLQGWLEPGTLH